MLEILSMLIYYLENYMPIKIHTFPYLHFRAITCLLNFMALWIDEFTQKHSWDSPILEGHMRIVLKHVSIKYIL